LGLEFTKVRYAHDVVEEPKELAYWLTIEYVFLEIQHQSNTITQVPPLTSTIIIDIIMPLKNGEIDEEHGVAYIYNYDIIPIQCFL
jgi:hypothetical protein